MTEKRYKGIVLFDVDGTLVDEREKIFKPTAATHAAVEKLKGNGYLTGLATGRAKCYVPNLGIDFDCYVTSNGAVAEVFGEVVFDDCIEPERLRSVIDYLEKNNIAYNAENHDACYFGEKRYPLLAEMLKKFCISSDAFRPYDRTEDIRANKLIAVFDREEQFSRMQRDLSGDFTVTRHHRNNSADIDKHGMNKAVGMSALAERLGIDVSDVYAFGDDVNDLDMLKAAGCGIAMTPHAKELEAVADMFTSGVAEDGVAKALTKLGLI